MNSSLREVVVLYPQCRDPHRCQRGSSGIFTQGAAGGHRQVPVRRALRGTGCTHDPHHGPDRSDQSKEVGVGIEPRGAEKLFYLGKALELIRVDFFRQTLFAEFQLAIHDEMEGGGSVSGERMTDMYCGLLKKYYGDSQGVLKVDPAYCAEWTYIPHFYYGFYVYQNATSMAGAAAFADALKKEGASAQARFIAMLKAGSSDYPYTLYKKAGLDMATPGR